MTMRGMADRGADQRDHRPDPAVAKRAFDTMKMTKIDLAAM